MDNNIKCRYGCGCITLFISAVLGAVAGVLVYFNLLPAITTAAWIVFGLGVLGLVILVFGLFLAANQPRPTLARSLSRRGICLLAGSVGSIVAALAAHSIALAAASVAPAVIVAIAAFFGFLMILSLISFLADILRHL